MQRLKKILAGFGALLLAGTIWLFCLHFFFTEPAAQFHSATAVARFAPDGRNVNPLSVLTTDSRTRILSEFNGLDPNGTWTLFVADLSSGDQATVSSWGLSITAIPEPATCGAIFGATAAAAAVVFCSRRRPSV